MTNRKGFTLVELLAVIVILAIILAVAIPGISKLLTSSKASAYNSQIDLIKRAASLYITEHSEQTTVSLGQLIDKGLITDSVVNPITEKPFDTGLTIDIKTSNNATSYEIYEGPTLVTGMIPVYYDDASGKWRKADKSNIDNNWYDYNNQKWANAVTVTTSSRETTYQDVAVGEAIEMADINAMFVWIPRYKYLIPAGTGPREIKIIFETRYAPKSTGNAITSYYTHPAFTFGTEELGGIWVGKFETNGTISAPTIKPELASIRDKTIKAIYEGVKANMQSNSTFGFTSDNDIHLMKNMEWGAVAYLSYSTYGKYGNSNYIGANRELYINNSSSFYAGRSSGAPGGSSTLTTLWDGSNLREPAPNGYYTYDGKCASIDAKLPAPCDSGSTGQALTDKTLAYGASTTGTIYGIYDMSGGSFEYVMGMYKPTTLSGIKDCSGYSTSYAPPIACPSTDPYDSQYEDLTMDSKYYNQYLSSPASTGAILGDATKEVAAWYSDYSSFVSSTNPWLFRGGRFESGNGAGAFSFHADAGSGYGSAYSFRITLTPNN